MARRAHSPDPLSRRQVEALAGYGIPETQIAGMIGIDPKTLRKHYRDQLDHGHTKANAKVAENLYRKATGDSREGVTAAIFWLKCRAGWKERIVSEVSVTAADPLSQLLHQVAGAGRRIHDRPAVGANVPGGPGTAVVLNDPLARTSH